MENGGFRYSGLPLKITGIVFWGMALIGLFLSFILLQGMSGQISEANQGKADRFTMALLREAPAHEEVNAGSLGQTVERLRAEIGIPAAVVYFRNQVIRSGDITDGLSVYKKDIHWNKHNDIRRLSIYLPNVKLAVVEKRKQMVLIMGGTFLVFGFILQWILQKVLAEPFLGMLVTARKCASGNAVVRFNNTRDDEFGFLSGFINETLDFARFKQTELENALMRVRDSEIALHREKERAEVTLYSIGDAVITTDKDGKVDYFNPVAGELTGWSSRQANSRPLKEVFSLVDEDSREPVECPVARCLKTGEVVKNATHALLVSTRGEEVSIANTVSPIQDRDGEIVGAVMVFHDEGETRKLARQLSHQATHDVLTDLYNRREFERRLELAIHEAKETGRHYSLCYLDLDQFKLVNDTCGHVAGDELLRQLSGLLQEQIRESDVLARLGGDEFGVLLGNCTLERALQVAENIRKTISDYRFAYSGKSFEVGASIGMVSIEDGSKTSADLMSTADLACYAAKDAGRNRIHVYEPSDRDVKTRHGEMQWVSRLREAISEDHFRLYIQPIVPVNKSVVPTHHEILLRLAEEDGNIVPPMAFIPAAERYNMMSNIDRWVVNTVFQKYGELLSQLPRSIYTINLSGQSLCENNFLDFVIDQFDQSLLQPDRVCFEITETAAIKNLMHAMRFISILKDHGCRFALDDFGSGLSSFGYLKSMKVDYLKIDGSFIRDMTDDPIDCAMVSAINEIGHVMGIETIAEFVESEEIMKHLHTLGVDYAQGFWIGEPVSIDDFLVCAAPDISDKQKATG